MIEFTDSYGSKAIVFGRNRSLTAKNFGWKCGGGQNTIGVSTGQFDKKIKLILILPESLIFNGESDNSIPSHLFQGNDFPPYQIFIEDLFPSGFF
jgi:hypothetical protein